MTLHDDGKGYFSIEMDRKPTILPYLASEKDLIYNDESNESSLPVKASLVFKMDESMIYLGDVKDNEFKLLRSLDTDVNSIDGYSIKLSKEGKLEVLDDQGQLKDMSTNFRGNSIKS